MQLTKKEIEAYYLKRFSQSIESFPKGNIIPSESPDFILDTGEYKIGIEITRIYKSANFRGTNPQVQENEQNLLRAECKKIYDEMGLPNVEVHILFNSFTSFNKKNRREYANKIVQLVSMNLPPSRGVHRIVNDYKNVNTFPFEIDSITIYRFGYNKSFWGESGVGFVQQHFINELQEVIDKKNILVSSYTNCCAYYWLLVVIEGLRDSSFFDPSAETLNHSYKSNFNKVFLYNGFSEKGHELKIVSAD